MTFDYAEQLRALAEAATPGPWGNFMGPHVLRAYDHQTRLAIFDAHEGTDYEQPAKANARLAALAPSLAVALAEAVEALEAYEEDHRLRGATICRCRLCKAYRSLVARVAGILEGADA